MNDELKFYIDGVETPIDHYWEISEKEKQPGRLGDSMYKTPGLWTLSLMKDGNRVMRHELNRLDDDTIRFAAMFVATQFMADNRAKALEDGPVRIVSNN